MSSVAELMSKGVVVGGRPPGVTQLDMDFARVIHDDAPLVHYINWHYYNGVAPLSFRSSQQPRKELRAGLTISPTKIVADPTFNGLDSVDFSGIPTTTDLRIKGSKQSLSFTVIFLITRGAQPKNGNIWSMSITDSVYPQNMAIASNGALQCTNTGGGVGNFHSVAPGDMGPIDSPLLAIWDYDDPSRRSTIFLNQGVTPHSSIILPLNAKVAPGAEYCIGGAGQPSSGGFGHDGKIAHVSLMFEKSMRLHDPRTLANTAAMYRHHLGWD